MDGIDTSFAEDGVAQEPAVAAEDLQQTIDTFVSDDNKTGQLGEEDEGINTSRREGSIAALEATSLRNDDDREKQAGTGEGKPAPEGVDLSIASDQSLDSNGERPPTPPFATMREAPSHFGEGSVQHLADEASIAEERPVASTSQTTLDDLNRPAEESPARLQPATTPTWRESSAFDALDESWIEPQAAEATVKAAQGQDGAFEEAATTPKNEESAQQQSAEASTTPTLLRPGPSSPAYRLASHQMPIASEDDDSGTMSFVDDDDGDEEGLREPGPSNQPIRAASPVRSGRSMSSSSSGEKQGSRAMIARLEEADVEGAHPRGAASDVAEDKDTRANDQDDVTEFATNLNDETGAEKFGSAREHMSYASALVGAITAEEPTFIEHSEVTPVPEFLKPDWAKKGKKGRGRDIFTPLQLETMFEPPSFVREQRQEVGPEEQAAQLAQGAADDVSAAESSVMAAEEEERSRDMSTESMSTASIPQGETSAASEGQSAMQRSGEPTAELSRDEGNDESIDPSMAEQRRQPIVPQCTFTFASPAEQAKEIASVPPTPSGGRPPLRLFHLRDKKAEIEQILNTPRSPEKAADARRIVWELVGHGQADNGPRESKRLRLDQVPHTAAPEVILEEQEENEEEDAIDNVENAPLAPMPRESTPLEPQAAARQDARDRPRFMDRLQKLRAIVDKQPTRGEGGPLLRRALQPSDAQNAPDVQFRERIAHVERTESPRKLLRHWSAANEVDEELSREASSSDTATEAQPQRHEQDSAVTGSNGVRASANVILEADHGLADRLGPRQLSSANYGQINNGEINHRDERHNRERVLQARALRREASDAKDDLFSVSGSRSLSPRYGQPPAPVIGPSKEKNEIHITVSDMTGNDSVPTERSFSSIDQAAMQMPMLATPARAPADMRSATPRSILKTGGMNPRILPSSVNRPTARSISFAEGHETRSFMRSERVEKVEELLKQLAVLALGPDEKSVDLSFLDQLTPTRPTVAENSKRARSPWNLSMLRGHRESGSNDEASFLTNASFHVAHDRLLELITDVAPYEDDWRDLLSIDLRGRRVDSLNRMKEFLPRLEHAMLDDNEISYLSGLPSSLRTLTIARNRLPSSAAFGALVNLETLDVSHNSIDLKALTKLTRLRHLRVDENNITSLDGIESLSRLETLHLRGNHLRELVIRRGQWPQLRDLVVSHNNLLEIRGLSYLQRLRSLNLDHNDLEEVDLGRSMSSLRQLRLSGNTRLATLDVGPVRNLRTLYADDCALDEVLNIGLLQKLDNLSLRQQQGRGSLHWPAREIRDIKRLFLSGNAFRAVDLGSTDLPNGLRAPLHVAPSALGLTKFYGMVYLELSACQLTTLPEELADMVPNLRHLNADHNLLQSLPDMTNLKRLKRLSLVGCRIDPSRALVESLQGCDELLTLDVRLNPCTLGLYAPIMLTAPQAHADGAHARSEKSMRAFLPPIPHPSLARPDKAWNEGSPKRSANGAAKGAGSLGEKSFFHKKHPPPYLAGDAPGDSEDDEEYSIEPTIHGSRMRPSASSKQKAGKDRHDGGAFAAADGRFARTLPAQFRLQRLLHRGTLAMACASLTWLDGILIDEDEVRQADEYYRRRLNDLRNDASGAFTANVSPPESIFSSDSL